MAMPIRTVVNELSSLSDIRRRPASELQATVQTIASRSLTGVVGNTPLLWIDEPIGASGRGFWAKLEGYNPGGIKDRPALHMVARARARGQLRPGRPIIESTSGTLGLG